MIDTLVPVWPDLLQEVDVVQGRFVLDFLTPCQVQPADFLGLGTSLRATAGVLTDANDGVALGRLENLFRPPLSDDPVARRKFQKPAPGFVVTIPVHQATSLDVGDQLDLQVLFIGTCIPCIHDFLASLIQLGRQGLINGAGCFEVSAVYNRASDQADHLAWRLGDRLEHLPCTVRPLTWLLQKSMIANCVTLTYLTPARLLTDHKPLRQPSFHQVFPFMLRRVSAMLYTYCGIELSDDAMQILTLARSLEERERRLQWRDWRILPGRQGQKVGGFVGQAQLAGEGLADLYWVLSTASLLGIGKGATYGAGHFTVSA